MALTTGDPLPAQDRQAVLPTPAERTDYLSFTPAEEVAPFLAAVAERAGDGRATELEAPTPLPLLHLPPRDSSGTAPIVRVLVIAARHGDERAGLEVALRLARDLALGPLSSLRGRLDVRLIPMANPTAVASRERTAPGGVDLATDHLVQRAPETRALWREFRSWRPHVVLDLHELGPSEYSVQIAVPTHPNAHPRIRELARFYLLPHAANALARADVRFHEYVSPWRGDATSEVAARPVADTAVDAWFSPPATDPARSWNAFALAGAVPLFVATASSRDVLGLAERSERLFVAAEALLRASAAVAPTLLSTLEAATGRPTEPLAVAHRYRAAGPDAHLPWIYINERGLREPGRLAPWRSELEVDSAVVAPNGWWIPSSATDLLATLRAHEFDLGAAAPDVAEAGRPSPDAVWVTADQRDPRLLFTLMGSPTAGDRPIPVIE